jgi:hypothetical protein
MIRLAVRHTLRGQLDAARAERDEALCLLAVEAAERQRLAALLVAELRKPVQIGVTS